MFRTRSRVVGIDMDGVVSDIVQQVIVFSRDLYGLTLSSRDIRSENIENCTPIRREQLVSMFESHEFFRTMPPVSGAKDSIELLKGAGCEIHIITDRFWYPKISEDTCEWLNAHGIRYDSITFARKDEKQHVGKELRLGWFIEDQLSNARLLSTVCPVLLLDTPYNTGDTNPAIIRVNNLAGAVDAILSEDSIAVAGNGMRIVNGDTA